MQTIFLVVAAFLLTWLPMTILAVMDIVVAVGPITSWTPPGWLHTLAMWSLCSGSVTYPILYGVYNRAIRKELRLCLSWSAPAWRSSQVYRNQRSGSTWSNYSGGFFFFFKDFVLKV